MPARPSRSFYLHLAIPGWQGRVDDTCPVTLRDTLTHEDVLILTPAEVVAMLTNYVNQASITAGLLARPDYSPEPRPALPSAPSRAPLRSVGVPLRPIQEARRAARVLRKGRSRRRVSKP